MTIKPPALKQGDLIGIMSPSSAVEKGDLDSGIKLLENRGFNVEIHPQTYLKHHSSAGTSAQKISALHDFWSRKDMRAIIAAGGGNRALHLLDDIDYGHIRRHPKIIMGFSDVTALLNAFNARAAMTTFHGPVLKWLPRTTDLDHAFDLMAGKKVSYPMNDTQIIHTGVAHGPLIGGNLTVFSHLIGTKYMPKMDGAILFLEDVNEETSNLDRLFLRLRRTGVMDRISGLVLGQFSDSKDTGKKPFGFSLEEIFREHTQGLKIPIVTNAPFGHVDTLYTMPIGTPTRLSVRRQGHRVSLTLSEPAVKI